jgi:branched-chain amino acid transport system permease protein
MHALIQGVILGVLTGGVYALMASGQTLIFGIMKVVNLAQGAMVILGAYLAFELFVSFGIDPFLAIPLTTAAMFCLGVGIQYAFLRPLKRDDAAELSLLITFAVALLLEGIMSVGWKTTRRSINTSYSNSSWTLFGYQVTVVRFWGCVLSVVPPACWASRHSASRPSASGSARQPRRPPGRCTHCSTRSTPEATTT